MKTGKLKFMSLLAIFLGLTIWVNAAQFTSVKDGAWDDAGVWSGGQVPGQQDEVQILHKVTTAGGFTVGNLGKLIVAQGGTLVVGGGMNMYGYFEVKGMAEITGGYEHYGRAIWDGTVKVFGDIEIRGGSLTNTGTTLASQDITIYVGAFWEQIGLTRVAGDLNNWGTTHGGAGMFRVCGDADHDGWVEGLVYLCMECDGQYHDRGAGTFVLECMSFPVVFTDFTGLLTQKGIKLEWVTQSESNSDRFVVERAVQAITDQCSLGVCTGTVPYEAIGELKAAGNSTTALKYTFLDENPGMGINFYRVKIIDLEGNYEYSNAIHVSSTEFKSNLEVFPNPNNDVLFIRVLSNGDPSSQLNLYDIQGRKIWDAKLSMKAGEEQVIELPSRSYAAGTYIVEFRNGNKKLSKKVFFVK